MFASEQRIEKLCVEDIMEEREISEIKVSSQQNVVYKFAKCETLRKENKKRKLKNKWKLQNINAPNSKSIKISLWTKNNNNNNNNNNNINTNLNNNKIPMKYVPGNNEMYHKLALSSMEWNRNETDLLLTLCNTFNNRWSVIIDRYNSCKPIGCKNRNIIQIKQRYYECKNITNNQNNQNTNFKYNSMMEQKRRDELSKLLMRTYDNNMEISSTIQCYQKHNKLLKKKINEMHQKKMQLQKQSHFIILRQQPKQKEQHNTNNNNTFMNESYLGYGVTIRDNFAPKPMNNQKNILDLPLNCIPQKVKKVKRYIQIIDDEYTKYKYELKLNAQKATIVTFPYMDKTAHANDKNSKKKNNNHNNNNNLSMSQILTTSNPGLGKEIAKNIQKELVEQNIISIDKEKGTPKMYPMTNTTRAMFNVLREDYIKYYAMQTLINDLKKKQQQK